LKKCPSSVVFPVVSSSPVGAMYIWVVISNPAMVEGGSFEKMFDLKITIFNFPSFEN
jgi:hypothetical protein